MKYGKVFAGFNLHIDKILTAEIGAGNRLIKFVIRLIAVIMIFFISVKILLLDVIVQFIYDHLLCGCWCKFNVRTILGFDYVEFGETMKFSRIK